MTEQDLRDYEAYLRAGATKICLYPFPMTELIALARDGLRFRDWQEDRLRMAKQCRELGISIGRIVVE